MMSLMRSIQKESVVISSTALSCAGNKPYGMGILDAQVWDDKTKQFSKAFVLTVNRQRKLLLLIEMCRS